MEWADFIERAIEVPFVEKGRSFDGWDCWGLVCCAYSEVFRCTLPTFEERYETTTEARRLMWVFADETVGPQWMEVARRPAAIAVIRRRQRPIHAGLVVSERDILHCETGVGTVIEPERRLHVLGYWIPAWLPSTSPLP